MTRETLRRRGAWALLALELLGGVAGFALAPQGAFPEVVEQPLGALGLRLAADAHLALVVVSAGLLRGAPGAWSARLVALGQGTYHALAGLDGLRLAAGAVSVTVLPTPWMPALTHGVLGGAAWLLWALPVRPTSAPEAPR